MQPTASGYQAWRWVGTSPDLWLLYGNGTTPAQARRRLAWQRLLFALHIRPARLRRA